MRTSESISKIAPALRAAQEEMTSVTKDAKNPYYRSRYATLDACWNTAKPSLMKNKIAVIQMPSIDSQGRQILTTRLLHESGEWIEGDYLLVPTKDDPQGMGSAITYARRYALCAAIGLCAEEDDDGNAASKSAAPAQRTVPSSQTGHHAAHELKKLVALWSGAHPEDLSAACLAVFRRLGLPTDRTKMIGVHFEQALTWVKEQMNEGVEFADAIAQGA